MASWTAHDEDDQALIWVFADRDGDAATEPDRVLLAGPLVEQGGASASCTVPTGGPDGLGDGTWSILVLCADFESDPVAAFAPGRVTVEDRSWRFVEAGGDPPIGSIVDRSLEAAADGGFVRAGTVTGTVLLREGRPGATRISSVANGPLGANPPIAFVARHSADGSLAWARQAVPGAPPLALGPDGLYPPLPGFACEARHVAPCADGGLAAAGTLLGTATFGADEVGATALTGTNPAAESWIARYDAAGALLWAKLVPLVVVGLACDPEGVLAVASLRGSVTLDPGAPSELALRSRSVVTTALTFDGQGSFYSVESRDPTADLVATRWSRTGALADAFAYGPTGSAAAVTILDARPAPDGGLLVAMAAGAPPPPPIATFVLSVELDPLEAYLTHVDAGSEAFVRLVPGGALAWQGGTAGSRRGPGMPLADGGALHVAHTDDPFQAESASRGTLFVGEGLYVERLDAAGRTVSCVGGMGHPGTGTAEVYGIGALADGGCALSIRHQFVTHGVYGRVGGSQAAFPGTRNLLLALDEDGDLLWGRDETSPHEVVVHADGTLLLWGSPGGIGVHEQRNPDGSGR